MKYLKRISKSIMFSDEAVQKLDALAKELGFTRLDNKKAKENGDISKIVVMMVGFGLANPDQLKQWIVNGRQSAGGNQKREKKVKA